ncbi:MAG TPA: diacylglycerol kinase family protein [Planctomycetota bacterium]|nr:diacylglycerol kinase family protein [Planctomycetota bacterium]
MDHRAGLRPFLARRCRSFACAGRGLWQMCTGQVHGRFHLVAAVTVVAAGAAFGLSAGEWCAVALAIAGVFAAEACNTALEQLADALHPALDPGVGRAKDLAAGAVLAAALGAAAVGGIVFLPRLL